MSRQKVSLLDIEGNQGFSRMFKKAHIKLIESERFPLWWRIYFYIVAHVELNDGYVSTKIIDELAKFFNKDARNIRTNISILIDEGFLLRYPFGSKKAKGYILNPEYTWVGDDNSRDERLRVYYRSAKNLVVEVDPDEVNEISIRMVKKKKNDYEVSELLV